MKGTLRFDLLADEVRWRALRKEHMFSGGREEVGLPCAASPYSDTWIHILLILARWQQACRQEVILAGEVTLNA
jgi:hypothetical protein